MNKRALLNAVVRNVMTKIAALLTKGSAAPQAKPTEPKLDPGLGSELSMKARGGIFDLLEDKYGARPYFEEQRLPDSLGGGVYVNYRTPSSKIITNANLYDKNDAIIPDFRERLRGSIAFRAGESLYPIVTENHRAFFDAAKRFGEYRQLQQQNLGTLKNSLLFEDWAHDNAPLVYRKLMNAPKKNRDRALLLLKWQVNNRRNRGNGYV